MIFTVIHLFVALNGL